jgi:hypothetical protein
MITAPTVARVLELVSAETNLPVGSLVYELQDDGDFCLVLLDAPAELLSTDLRSAFARIQDQMDAIVPKRAGEYAWMVSARRAGGIVESVFGGDEDCPLSGFI